MIRVFQEKEKQLNVRMIEIDEIPSIEENTWIDIKNPTNEVLESVSKLTGLPFEMLNAPLDEEEMAHVEIDEGDNLIVLDTPYLEDEENLSYNTAPFIIVYNDKFLVTLSKHDFELIPELLRRYKKVEPHKHIRLTILLLYRLANLYINYLKKLDLHTKAVENKLEKAMKNSELFDLMEINKSIVYFSTALNANRAVLLKLFRNEKYKRYEADLDLMEDTQIEMNQAIEMCQIQSNVLTTMMNTYGSVISNNLNIAMKALAVLTIVISIPTLVASFFGMNVDVPGDINNPTLFWIVVVCSFLLAGIGAVALIFLTRNRRK